MNIQYLKFQYYMLQERLRQEEAKRRSEAFKKMMEGKKREEEARKREEEERQKELEQAKKREMEKVSRKYFLRMFTSISNHKQQALAASKPDDHEMKPLPPMVHKIL